MSLSSVLLKIDSWAIVHTALQCDGVDWQQSNWPPFHQSYDKPHLLKAALMWKINCPIIKFLRWVKSNWEFIVCLLLILKYWYFTPLSLYQSSIYMLWISLGTMEVDTFLDLTKKKKKKLFICMPGISFFCPKDSPEALILSAQEQALSTRAIEIHHTRQDPRCRLCKEALETIQQQLWGVRCWQGKQT